MPLSMLSIDYIISMFLFADYPFDAHCYHMGTAIKHRVPDRVKPSFFVIFDIQAL